MRLTLMLSALAMAACTTQPGEVEADPVASETAGAEGVSPQPIEGRFVVASVDGAPPVINIAGHEPTVTIDGDRIHFQSQCIYADWTLARSGGKVSTKPYFEPGSGMCARGLAPGETAIQDAFTGLTAITRTAAGGLVVDGGGHRLELRQAAAPREAPPPLAPVTTLAGEWRVAAIDGKDFNEPHGLALSGSETQLWWEPRCLGVIRNYRIRGSSVTFGPPRVPPPSPPCLAPLHQSVGKVLAALDAATTVVRTPANGVLVSGGGRSVLLFSQ